MKLYDQETPQPFAPALSPDRLNRLFRVLQSKEKEYGSILSDLGVVSFEQLAEQILGGSPESQGETSPFATYRNEVDAFLRVNRASQRLMVRNGFVDYLRNVSNVYSFNSPLKSMKHKPFWRVKCMC